MMMMSNEKMEMEMMMWEGRRERGRDVERESERDPEL